ncbi:mitochondrial import inner membrane translocase subunit TIM10, putative [Toxoplasma gondii ME49]|uniref:Mitochondrial import inner membrane translocase subunit n=2 Tax=Toxoplasma gondii TaxID=5811 RepID=S8GLV2_TOXGM|nr:mitochondrial import inner membrane translocase subunit TIM10, putative [Toxoplasma gondii ME49]EPT29539.1 mitochondrial import inner membrane translocase subunit TIM10, putative [Toxoplasma gondii ME49]KYF41499.1 putative mitochondrial import inner membrane translocase subunit TIM10 [Toxoplasma gondii ARI]|eukprot:XP_002365248.1 mitochondrial import inner membrane translocase subunit TIM10, putative [Toxoplasma gondii ME49]
MGASFSSRLGSSPSSSSPSSSGSSSLYASDRITPQVAALAELQGFADTVSRCIGACYTRCLHKHAEVALDVSEMSCTDRCVAKYFHVHALVGESMKALASGPPGEN